MKVWIFIGIFILLLIVYLLGPKANIPFLNNEKKIFPEVLNCELSKLDSLLKDKESKVKNLKPDNQAHIVWGDSSKTVTEYSLVYLHGFSASQKDGDPIHLNFAKEFGLNLFLARLTDHGIKDSESFRYLTPEQLVDDAKFAVAIGKKIGKKVIVMSSSTGSTLSLFLAAQDLDIYAQLMYSPNIDLNNNLSDIMLLPWGKQITQMMFGGNYRTWETSAEAQKYWTTTYRIEGLICLKSLVRATMVEEIWKNVKQPTFMGYYYKDEENQDDVVSVYKMLEMFNSLGTIDDKKQKSAFPTTKSHIIASDLWSGDIVAVQEESFKFARDILGLIPTKK